MNARFTRSFLASEANQARRAWRQPSCSALLALSVCLLSALPALGGEPVSARARSSTAFGLRSDAPAAVVAATPSPSAGVCGSIFSPLQSALGNRRRMLQFGVIGMCIALYIIMWRR